MKTIGLIGGMSWQSTIAYYRLINEGVQAKLGGHASARCVLISLDFAPIEEKQRQGRWEEMGQELAAAARQLEGAGAACVLVCANTMHKVAPAVAAAVRVPVIHIVDVTADAIRARGFGTVGLIGTRFTMEDDFYRGRLESKHGLRVVLPDAADRERVHHAIYEELTRGRFLDATRKELQATVERLAGQGAQVVILGCTEFGLLLRPGDASIPLLDSTALHAAAAVAVALG